MEKLKPNSQSKKYWFQVNNYPAEWLDDKSKEIIKKIIKKNK